MLYFAYGAYLGPCTAGATTFALLNNMSCYVYRNLRFGLFVDDTITSSFVNRALNRPVGTPRPEDKVERSHVKELPEHLSAEKGAEQIENRG